MKKRNWSFIPIILVFLCLSACGSKSANTAVESDYANPSVDLQSNSETGNVVAEQPGSGAVTSAKINGTEGNRTLPSGRKLIRNVSMSIETDTFEDLISRLQTDISKAGGYIEQSDISGNRLSSRKDTGRRYASITARIPVNQLDTFISKVRTNGNVTNKSESTQDITLQYSDLESKKKSLLIEQKKMWEFLEKADSADTVITLEKRLSEIRYQLESMESQLKIYDNQVDYSTVNLSIDEVTNFTPTAPESAGTRIQKGLADNFKLFQTAIVNLLIGIITTLPFWLPIILIAGILIFLRRKHKTKKQPSPPPASEEDKSPGN